ncbi:MAG: TRAP transporter small permease [Rhizobiaceae bacterium]|nr:TRAP transporter small permease [Rhizobiaceae bacterium]
MSLSAFVERLARALAAYGGVVLIVLTALTVVSITGRAIGTFAHGDTDGPLQLLREGALWLINIEIDIGGWTFSVGNVPGDFELVEAGVAFAIFSFLPWCQYARGHATVDIFTNFLSARTNRVIDFITELLMTVFIVVVAWRLWYGMLDKIRYNETTFILQFPIWWAFAACMAAAAIGVFVSLFLLYERGRELATGVSLRSPGGGGE